jgi:gliding motility-associated-like protein
MKNLLLTFLIVFTSIALAQFNIPNVDYCGPGPATFSTSDAGCSAYEWYDESGQLLETGCDFISNITAFDKEYTVSDPNITNTGTFGYDFNSAGLTGWQSGVFNSDPISKYTTNFQVNSPIIFNSIEIQYDALAADPGGDLFSVSIIDNGGNVVASVVPTVFFDGGTHTLTIPINASLTPGSYKIRLQDEGSTWFLRENKVYVHTGGGDFTDGGPMDYQEVTINRTDEEGDNDSKIHDGTGGAYNWNLSSASSTSVVASDTCAANACVSVGQPLAFIDFGNGTNESGPALDNDATTYTFNNLNTASGAIDGQYTVVHSAFDAAGSTIGGWHDGEDHTPGDNNGYMLMVNADIQPGEFYRKQVNDLCENTFYVFSAYLANLLQPTACGGSGIAPDVTFRIEDLNGNVLMNETTGNIPFSNSLTWLEYDFRFFLTQGASSINLVLINNAPGGCGNDIVIDDIAFRPCGPDLQISSSTPMPACVGSDVLLEGIINTELQTASLQWQISTDTGATFFNIPGAIDEEYTLPALIDGEQYRLQAVITDGTGASSCPVFSNVITISTMSIETETTDQDPLCVGDDRNISVTDRGGIYVWSILTGGPFLTMNATTNSTVNLTGTSAGISELVIAETFNGCTAYDTTEIEIKALPTVTLSLPAITCDNDSLASITVTPANGTLSGDGVINGSFDPTSNELTPNTSTAITYSFTDEFGCENSVTKSTQIVGVPDLSITIDDNLICKGEFTNLHYQSSGINSAFEWFKDNNSFSSNLTDLVISEAGNYHAQAALNGCTAKSNIETLELSSIEIEIEDEFTIIEGETILLSPNYNLTPILNFDALWVGIEDGSSYSDPAITVAPIVDNFYIVDATNELGCTASDSLLVIVKHPIRVPEIISPNGDGLNDEWIIKNIHEYPEAVVKVFNRLGNVIYKSYGYDNDWQGTFGGQDLPVATYYYVIELPTVNENHTGSLTIIK